MVVGPMVVGLLMSEDPYPVPLLLASPHWPSWEAGVSGAKGLGASGPGVGGQGYGNP